ncbi:MAG TPA: uracil-DNA glycosylase [Anaeromyxobacter sp.]|nr:uracil-DNA glycosylase [Anaeromyxobacter sp.]
MSGDAQERATAIAEVAAEVERHLRWLEAAGVRELPPPSPEALARAAAATSAGRERAPAAPAPDVGAPRSGGERTPAPPAVAGQAPYTTSAKGCGSAALLAVRAELGECTRCKLGAGRTRLVFGVGNPAADLVFVGEGPGEDEDRQGEPFVGRAGQLLTKMIEAMGRRREDVYIANVVKCRPPGNRNPEADEIQACEPFLRAQLAAIQPRVIVALGKFAAQTLLRDTTPISRLRGRWSEYEGIRLMPTFHPAYLLRSPDEKKKAWEDLKLVMKELATPPSPR